jgi:outer membrane protein OmpA-like peptidoglycan-associated protein
MTCRLPNVAAVAAALLLAVVQPAQAQLRTEYGLLGTLGYNMHESSFRQLGVFPSCCPEFSGGTAWGSALGAYVALPFGDGWRFHARLTYANEGAPQSYDESSFVADLRDSARVVPAVFRHTLSASIFTLGVEPLIGLRLGNLEIVGGMRAALPVTAQFAQREELIEPSDFGEYVGDDRTWVETDADIPNVPAMRLGLMGGLRYDVVLNAKGTLVLTPEVSYHYDISGVSDGVMWNANQLRMGVSLGFRPVKPEPAVEPVQPVEDTLPPPPPPAPVRPLLMASVKAELLDDEVTMSSDTVIRIDETVASDLRPLLNHVYFSKGGDAIPERYRRLTPAQTATFAEDQLYVLYTIETYHHVMNIVAQRLTARPNARLRLVGCLSEDDGTTDLGLAKRRAEAVRAYFVDVWDIEPARISIDTRTYPERPTKAADPGQNPLAYEENRRVELVVTDAAVMAPVIATDTIRTATPPIVRFTSDVTADAGVSNWTIEATHNGRPLFTRKGEGGKPPVIDWNVAADRATTPRTDAPILYRLIVEDSTAHVVQTLPQQLPVRQITIRKKRVERIADREIDRYRLILFEFNDAGVKGQNAAIVDLIKRRITPASTVTITGFTDNIGTASYNRELARQRAERTATSLGQPLSTIKAATAQAPFPLDLPEGRAYARTVTVVVETPVK